MYNPLKAHSSYLSIFWQEYRYKDNRTRSLRSKEEVIRALQQAGNVFIYYSQKAPTPEMQKVMLVKDREKFDRIKNVRYRFKFRPNDECLACGNKPKVRHHIIWLKHGGRNVKRNICFLCNYCHAEVHPWLKNQ